MTAVQEINLFHSNLRPRRVPLQFRDLKRGCFVLLAICLTSGALRYQSLTDTRAEHAAAARKLAALNAAGARLRAGADSAELLAVKEEVSRLGAVQRAQQELLGLLQEGAQRQHEIPFSVQLQELARRSLEGVWLTRIQLDAAARTIALYGRARRPVLVPELLQSLAGTSAYQGYEFDRFEITETEDGDHRFAVVGPEATTE